MKATLLIAMLSLMGAVPGASAATEVETLRARCAEQERQIRRLEQENSKLRAGSSEVAAADAGRSEADASAPVKTAATEATSYTVCPGDSLERIARKTGCSLAKLAKANGLKASSIIRPGQKIKLPAKAESKPTSAAHPAVAAASRPGTGKTHQIQEGETYASIARKYGLSMESLVAANPEAKPTALRPGQVIRLTASEPIATPVAAGPAAPAAKEPAALDATTPREGEAAKSGSRAAETGKAASPASKPDAAASQKTPPEASSAQEPSSAVKSDKKTHAIKIESEMTYGEFAAKHGTDIKRLNDLNGLDLPKATVLAKGSELYVPTQP